MFEMLTCLDFGSEIAIKVASQITFYEKFSMAKKRSVVSGKANAPEETVGC